MITLQLLARTHWALNQKNFEVFKDIFILELFTSHMIAQLTEQGVIR